GASSRQTNTVSSTASRDCIVLNCVQSLGEVDCGLVTAPPSGVAACRVAPCARLATIANPIPPKRTSRMNDRFVRTGVFLAPFHALAENPLLCLERDMELLVHLDRLNYHEAWIGEHHSGGFEIIACPELFIAAAAERTRHIRLGTGV